MINWQFCEKRQQYVRPREEHKLEKILTNLSLILFLSFTVSKWEISENYFKILFWQINNVAIATTCLLYQLWAFIFNFMICMNVCVCSLQRNIHKFIHPFLVLVVMTIDSLAGSSAIINKTQLTSIATKNYVNL